LKNKCKVKNEEIKSETEDITSILSSSTDIISASSSSSHTNLELPSDDSNLIPEEIPDIPYNRDDDLDEDIPESLLFKLDEVHQIVSKEFEEEKISNEPVKFSFEIEMDPALSEILLLDQQSTTDLRSFEKHFQEVANILIVPIESGSGYHWETCKIYLNTKKKELIGHAVVYLGCAQRSDWAFQRSENQEVRR